MSRIIATKPRPGAQVDWGNPINRGLVGWWLFNEGAGLRAADLTGQNDGTITDANAATIWVGSPQGGGLEFQAAGNDYVNVPDSPSLDSLTDAITIAVWIKVRNFGQFDRLVDKNVSQWTLVLTGTSPYTGIEFYANGGQRIKTATGVLTAGTWHFVVVTYDKDLGGNDEFKCYVDDVLEDTGDYSAAITTNNDPLSIGSQTGGGAHIDGMMDQVILYNRNLTTDEVG